MSHVFFGTIGIAWGLIGCLTYPWSRLLHLPAIDKTELLLSLHHLFLFVGLAAIVRHRLFFVIVSLASVALPVCYLLLHLLTSHHDDLAFGSIPLLLYASCCVTFCRPTRAPGHQPAALQDGLTEGCERN